MGDAKVMTINNSAAHEIIGANAEMLNDVEIPLRNLEYTIEQYLLAHGARLDAQTRLLLAGVRDCVGRVAGLKHQQSDTTRPLELETLSG